MDGEHPFGRCGDLLPEAAQACDAILRCISGDDRCVDRTDRDSGHPIGWIFGGGQRLVDAGLIAAERTAALQNERNLLVIGRRSRRSLTIGHLYILAQVARICNDGFPVLQLHGVQRHPGMAAGHIRDSCVVATKRGNGSRIAPSPRKSRRGAAPTVIRAARRSV